MISLKLQEVDVLMFARTFGKGPGICQRRTALIESDP